MSDTYVYKLYPWRDQFELKKGDAVELSKDKIKEAKELIMTTYMDLLDNYSRKRSAKGSIAQDEINFMCEDTGCPFIDDFEFAGLKPDKKTWLLDLKSWTNSMLKPLTAKKCGMPGEYYNSFIEGIKSKCEEWKKKVAEKDAEREKEKALKKYLTKLFDTIEAADSKPEDVKKVLEEMPEAVNAKFGSRAGATPLFAAAAKKRKDLCDLLLEMKADVNAQDNFKWTALNWAEENGNTDMMEYLESKGCEMGEGDDDDDDDDDDEE
mmetsp:Transcript_7139/g.9935  ORF Transcript_7139/g.9935 Transcript_7139/m.9935 type:complete len:265 (-) Transcript_7139:176-970(-)|eukprot:CAMPEP_0184487214 /NCGR_PEP_ID=MMETSP0113_2-20130426/9492_1 /TAXON_ID=91329 /ORGANISM="Norrisiella sphaerica, Strain BC52" /LENGTH=264 /DNA_ID=CAMNT_0026869429 /DNA_START=10 /DNA_END=804 /DNA_ORIENTATION=+